MREQLPCPDCCTSKMARTAASAPRLQLRGRLQSLAVIATIACLPLVSFRLSFVWPAFDYAVLVVKTADM